MLAHKILLVIFMHVMELYYSIMKLSTGNLANRKNLYYPDRYVSTECSTKETYYIQTYISSSTRRSTSALLINTADFIFDTL